MVEVNDGCPGETTKSFKGEGKNIGLGTNCNYQSLFTTFGPGTAGGPLHNPYPGKSQESNMLQILKGGAPAHPITAISINMGANDELEVVAVCKAEVKAELEKEPFPTENRNSQKAAENSTKSRKLRAQSTHAWQATRKGQTNFSINANLEAILGQIYGPGGYTGKNR